MEILDIPMIRLYILITVITFPLFGLEFSGKYWLSQANQQLCLAFLHAFDEQNREILKSIA